MDFFIAWVDECTIVVKDADARVLWQGHHSALKVLEALHDAGCLVLFHEVDPEAVADLTELLGD